MAQGVRHKPTPETRAQVCALVSFGVNRDRIAEFIGINGDTLAKWYPDELATGDIKRNSEVAGFLFTAASGQALEQGATYADCIRASMFWLKTRAQWRETNNVDDDGKVDALIAALAEFAKRAPV